jgi:hypothetical protein
MRYYFRHIKGEDNKVLIYTKITTFFQIKKKHFFSINQLAFSIEVDQNNFIIITIYDNDLKKIPQTFEFKPSDSPVSLGRHKCSVTLDYSVLSKKHCVINYDAEEKCWKICDGYAGRASTNGTWLLITSKFEIKEEATFFKVGENLFKITLS